MASLTLLAVQCKKSEPVDLRGPIYNYVASTYSAEQARDASEDLSSVQEERNEISGLTGSLGALAGTIQKYYCALNMMETRFPVSKDRSHVHISFKWYDAFRPTRPTEQSSIHFEKAAVLFNLGAIYTQQALGFDRSTDAGLKDAAKKFQEAAGVFVTLRDGPSLKVEQPRPIDISPECAAMLEKLCLAQAQECTFEKAKQDKKNPTVLARLAKQAAVFYQEVKLLLSNPPLNAHFDKSWITHTSVKTILYEAETQHQSANAYHADQEIGSEISRTKEAQKILDAAKKDLKGVSRELNESFRILNENLGYQLLRANKENATVYLQRVPNIQDLPQIAPAPLVKAIPPPLSSARDGLFASVIPDGSAKALSRYTDMVDSVIREQMDALEAASDDARIKLREWELPECLQALDEGSSAALPEATRLELERLEENGGVRHLQELQEQIKELRKVSDDELRSIEEEVQREVNEDNDYRQKYGQRWNRPVSVALNTQITEKIAGYRTNLAAAGESDKRLQNRLQESASALTSLSMDGAINQMPRLQAPMVSTGDVEPATVVARLRQALASVNELSNERAALEEALKVEKNRDNILPRIMSVSSSYDALFREEISKYDKLKADVSENVRKQQQLMDVIAQNQAAYKQAFGYNEWRAACEAAASGMRGKLATYRELQDSMGEGLRFYMSLQEAINTLRQNSGDFVLTRNIQRDDMLEDFRRGNEDEARRQKEAADKARQERAQQSLAQLNLNSNNAQWNTSQNYPPPPPWSNQSPAPPPPPVQAQAKPYQPPEPPQQSTGGSFHYPAQSQPSQGYNPSPPPPGAHGGQYQPHHTQSQPSNQSSQNLDASSQTSAPQWGSQNPTPPPAWQSQYYQPQQQYPPPQQYYQHPPYYQAPQYGAPQHPSPYQPQQGGQTQFNPFSGPPPPQSQQSQPPPGHTQHPHW